MGTDSIYSTPNASPRNPTLAAWKQARDEFPKDREKAIKRYREILQDQGTRRQPLGRSAKAAHDRRVSDMNLWN